MNRDKKCLLVIRIIKVQVIWHWTFQILAKESHCKRKEQIRHDLAKVRKDNREVRPWMFHAINLAVTPRNNKKQLTSSIKCT